MPGLPAVAPEDMGRLKTLGQIIDFMSGPRPETPPAAAASMALPAEPPAAAAAGRQALAQALLGVVSELTGYPVEMLGLEGRPRHRLHQARGDPLHPRRENAGTAGRRPRGHGTAEDPRADP
ncbi:MAG: hypothetical protein MUC33_15680 [Desulfobacterales bacterium]|nr:hypothetical protein [Desulfobacterales bacterium]